MKSLPVVLVNEGTIPANVKLELPLTKGFSISNPDRWVTIESKQNFTYEVTFHPGEIKQYTLEAKLRIQNNPFEVKFQEKIQ